MSETNKPDPTCYPQHQITQTAPKVNKSWLDNLEKHSDDFNSVESRDALTLIDAHRTLQAHVAKLEATERILERTLRNREEDVAELEELLFKPSVPLDQHKKITDSYEQDRENLCALNARMEERAIKAERELEVANTRVEIADRNMDNSTRQRDDAYRERGRCIADYDDATIELVEAQAKLASVESLNSDLCDAITRWQSRHAETARRLSIAESDNEGLRGSCEAYRTAIDDWRAALEDARELLLLCLSKIDLYDGVSLARDIRAFLDPRR